MQPAPIRDTRRLRLVVGKTVGAFLLAAALAGCNYTANTGELNPVAGPASSDPAAPAQPTTVDPPTVVPPVVVPPTPTIVPPQPEQATTCADSEYHSAGGNCARQPAPVVVPSKAASPPASSSGSSRGSVDLSALAAKVDPGLVDITSSLGHQNGGVAGTGIVLSSSGEVLTNNHVISGGASIDVTDVGNGQTYPATVVGYDRSHDVAVLQLQNASGLQTASIGDSDSVAVGDAIAAIGNAGGRGGTPSIVAGTVSGLSQAITVSDDLAGSAEQLAGLIRVAADLQPGDSGGPLVNTAGQVVGIDTAAATGSHSAGPEGFAIPINDAIAISKQIETGSASATVHIGPTGVLGIVVQAPTTQARDGSALAGALVTAVTAGSPCAQSGLAAGDVIVSLDTTAVDSPTTMITLLVGHHPGDLVPMEWVDPSGQQHTATVSLEVGPPT